MSDETILFRQRMQARLAALDERGERVTATCAKCGGDVETLLLPDDERTSICDECVRAVVVPDE